MKYTENTGCRLGTQILKVWIAALLSVFCLNAVAYSDPQSTAKSYVDSNAAQIQAAILKDDWNTLRSVFESQATAKERCSLESPARFLFGHACLATGKNTRAVESFYCIQDSTGSPTLKSWFEWTNAFVHGNPKSASALYLHGDALARLGKYEEALTEFDGAVAISPSHTLALNARGVVKWLLFEKDSSFAYMDTSASQDFITVTKTSPKFADAWANMGLIGFRDEAELERVRQNFNKALVIDSTFWFALNGKAAVAGVAGEYWEFERVIDHLMEKAPSTPYVQINAAPSGDKRVSPGARGASRMVSVMGDQMIKMGSDPVKWTGALMKSDAELRLAVMDQPEMKRFEQSNILAKATMKLLRGGIFIFVKEGENLVVLEDGSPRMAGTWFTLNYPMAEAPVSENKK